MYSTLQEQEHYDHVAGSFQNEFQAAYALSKSEANIRNDSKLISKWVAKGLFVAVREHDVTCRFTDGYIGRDIRIVGVCRNYERCVAMLKLGTYPQDEDNYVTGPKENS
jgi:hypothetical protein